MRNKTNKILLIWAIIVTVILIVVAVFEVVRVVGKSNLFAKNNVQAPQATSTEVLTAEENAMEWQSDWVKHNGQIYDYNEDILTFLVMGIDKLDEEVTEVYGEINGGQADALFLLVFNPHDKTTKIIGINRNTMTDVDFYDEYNNYITTSKAQIAIQHGFGDGVEGSCELQKKAVSNLFYQLPIHGYAAINMSAIATINDAIGGVTVVPKSDFSTKNYEFHEGEEVHLDGEAAFDFLKGRDVNQIGSADKRLERQKIYLTAFTNQILSQADNGPALAAKIYKEISKQMTTDVTLDELSYIASSVSSFSFDQDSVYLLKGKTMMGEKYEEFYPDEEAMYDMVLDIFYEKVDVNG
ncbi:LCP family protein [Butyrivibrio sp. NC2002]|uniref:LCP family protein n=1 Tax=Butyrivibrio sp. NC2002 TaxID=1410610 RepID=UPI00056A574B|nr:LCP family protein [Butyrivibrio sp. NC2002]